MEGRGGTNLPANSLREFRMRMQRWVHLCVLLLMMVSVMFYASTDLMPDMTRELNQEQPKDEYSSTQSLKLAPFSRKDLSFPSTTIYAHTALTMPRTNFQLANLAKTINVEPSRILNIDRDTTLRWTTNDQKALNLVPYHKLYGLTGLYVTSHNGTQMFTGLLRMPREICAAQATSWTCQINEEHMQFDNAYCVVIVMAPVLNDVLTAALQAAENQKIELSDPIVRGAFCGNPILQRIASAQDAVFYLNQSRGSKKPEKDSLLCKYNLETVELSQCIDIGMKNANYNKPLALIYDSHADSIVTVQYNKDHTLRMLAFNGQMLNLKSLFKSLPSPSGFFVHSEGFEGNVLFHGDVSLYEVDSVINLDSGNDVTIKPL